MPIGVPASRAVKREFFDLVCRAMSANNFGPMLAVARQIAPETAPAEVRDRPALHV